MNLLKLFYVPVVLQPLITSTKTCPRLRRTAEGPFGGSVMHRPELPDRTPKGGRIDRAPERCSVVLDMKNEHQVSVSYINKMPPSSKSCAAPCKTSVQIKGSRYPTWAASIRHWRPTRIFRQGSEMNLLNCWMSTPLSMIPCQDATAGITTEES